MLRLTPPLCTCLLLSCANVSVGTDLDKTVEQDPQTPTSNTQPENRPDDKTQPNQSATTLCPRPPDFVPEAIFTASYDIVFAQDSSSLPDGSEKRIQRLISDFFSTYQGQVIRLTGYRQGAESEQVSLDRARTVMRSLMAAGIEQGCISIHDGGTKNPIAREGSSESALNSRVEVQIEHYQSEHTESDG